MAYVNVYPSRINWENEPSINTPINAVNLNKIDYAVYEHDRTFATWDTTKANQSDLLLSVKTIDYDDETGVFIFTWQNGTTKTVDLNVEKIPVSFSMSPQGIITMTNADGTTYTADVSSLIKTYTFVDSDVIDFTVVTDPNGNKTVTADIVDGSITGAKLQPNYLADCQEAKTGAETAQGLSENSAEDAEAWAVGQRNGSDVPSTDPTYHNNAKYWSQKANPTVLANLTDVDLNNLADGQIIAYDSTTQKWKNITGGNSIAGLSDVSLTNLSANQLLRYNATTQKWENYSLSAATSSNMGLVMLGAGLTRNGSATDVDLTTTAYDNTISGLSATTAKGAIDENATDIKNKHKVTNIAVDLTGWTTDTTSQSGTTLYKKQVSLNNVYANPSVDIGSASGSVLPTTAQQEAYDLIQYVTVDTTVPCLYLYASDIPTDGFYINVEGVD